MPGNVVFARGRRFFGSGMHAYVLASYGGGKLLILQHSYNLRL